jgi:type I restriction enzyme, S subunit
VTGGPQWDYQALGEVAELITGPFGSSLKKHEYIVGGIPVVNPMHIDGGRLVPTSSMTVSPQTASRLETFRLRAGDVIIGRRGEMGRCAVVTDENDGWLCGTGSLIVRPQSKIYSAYLQRFLSSPSVVGLLEGASVGSTMVNLNQRIMRGLQIPLPPIGEQKRIADKLDRLLAAVAACTARLDAIPVILKRFRQSVLAAATSGELTQEWRSMSADSGTGIDRVRQDASLKFVYADRNPGLSKKKSSARTDPDAEYLFEIPESWAFTTWGAVSEWITYGFTRPMPASDHGVKLLTAKDVYAQDLRFEGAGCTTQSAFDALSLKDKPQHGDLLITKDGTIGRAALVDTNEPFCINQSVAVCWLRSTQMNRQYLEIVANAGFTQRFVRDKANGMAIQHLSITDFARCPIPVPPDAEQIEIVRRVESLLLLVDQLEKKVSNARARSGALVQSLLANAFRGELVPQRSNHAVTLHSSG